MIRNFLFKKFNNLRRINQDMLFGHLEYNRGTDLATEYEHNLKQEQVYKLYQFEQQQLVDAVQDPYERQKMNLYKQYFNNEINEETYETQTLKVNQIRRIRMLAESANQYDPEVIEFEKLKMKVILNEDNAVENYKQFLSNKPYMKKFHQFEENKAMKYLLLD